MGQQHGKRTRRKFSEEFKRDAVALVIETGRSIADVAAELGLYDSTLGNWVRRQRREAENADLRMERELLKRPVAFWVKESPPR